MRQIHFFILICTLHLFPVPVAQAETTKRDHLTSTNHPGNRWDGCLAVGKAGFFSSLGDVRNVVLTGGLRLFLRTHGPQDEQKFRYFIFREKPTGVGERWFDDIPGRFLQVMPRALSRRLSGQEYDFVPVQGSFEYLIRKPLTSTVSFLTFQKLKIRPTMLTEFVYFSVIAAASFHFFVDVPFFHAKNEQLVQEIENSEEISYLIASDFRFREIKQDLADGAIKEDEARIAAAGLRLEISSYQKWVTTSDEELTVAKDENTIIQLPMFSELKSVFLNGLQPQEGYVFKQPGPISIEQKEKLFALQNAYLYQMDIAALLIDAPAELKANPSAHVQHVVESIQKDAYYQALQHFFQKGYIDKAELKWRLQEDIFWRFKFVKYDALGIIKLKKSEDGSYTPEAVTIDDIRTQSIEEMKRIYQVRQG